MTTTTTRPSSAPAAHDALLGERELVTLQDGNDPDLCLSITLTRAGSVYVALVDDRAALLDRVRMGLVPRFVVYAEGSAAVRVSGEVELKILGRADASQDPRVKSLLGRQPFGVNNALAVEATPRALVREPAESTGPIGAVPHT
ncbi:MAG TPA: hypothetical protein VGO62_04485 [Myxococcota bacterium]|jgi:hypothetical protein